ncbi:DUF2778 domain-containing protein [Paraburkholderia sp.]|jgi:hypothetical protein|uniref:DUF2778 domain-containing protein n=1 Tax=Paraburkholderia sp. TaxID=1926495 RepID=UPI002F418830
MHHCTFELNEEPISTFEITGFSFPAFSGIGNHINKKLYSCLPDLGAISPGTYYIVDRQSGGRLGWLWDRVLRHQDWFALYAADGRIDDETFCANVRRGNFRLHSGTLSKGCITIIDPADFNVIKAMLRADRGSLIPGTDIRFYGEVLVE